MITIKWAVLMTYLIAAAPDNVALAPLPKDTVDCTTMPTGDYAGWYGVCVHSAAPEPIIYETVTELVRVLYDTRKDCQDSVDDAMERWSSLRKEERLIDLTLKCFSVDVGAP